MKIFYKTKSEIAKLREANLIVSDVLDVLEDKARPGVSTAELNEIADTALRKGGAVSAFLGYADPPYPAVLCTSINEVVVHGIPRRDQVLKDGDIVGIDFGAFKHGFCGDSARTVMIGKVSDEARRLVETTRRSLELAIEKCVAGNRLQDVGWAVQSYVEPLGYSVVRKFVGHGIGRAMHEDPQVPNYGEPHKGIKLKPGLVLAIEPMVNAGGSEVELLEDGWTAVTKDRSLSAHFEHSVAITDDAPLVLSRR
jgi:methionyl aminopeptidase